MKNILLVLLLATPWMTVCSAQETDVPFDINDFAHFQATQYTAPQKGSPAEHLIGDSLATHEASNEASRLTFAAIEIMIGSQSDQVKAQRIEALLDAPDVDPAVRWIADQNVSFRFLHYLLDQPVPDGQAVGLFVDRLVAVESPHADLVLRGLAHLDGVWSDEKRAQVAAAAAENAEHWATERCQSCFAKFKASGGGTSAALTAEEAIVAAASQLRAEVAER